MTAEEITALYEDFKARLSKEYYMYKKTEITNKELDARHLIDITLEESAHFYGYDTETLKSTKRHDTISLSRQVSFYLLRDLFGNKVSYHTMGRECGNRTHATALHGVRRISALCDVERQLKAEVDAIRTRIIERVK